MLFEDTISTTLSCAACHTPRPPDDLIPLSVVRPAIRRRLNVVYPDVSAVDRVCLSCLNRAISDEIDLTIEQEEHDFASMNADALRSLSTQEAATRNLNEEYDRSLPFGERMADQVASFGGSWRFIGLFVGILVVWIVVNGVHLLARPFGPASAGDPDEPEPTGVA
jgi:hypothetical protein